MRSADYWIKNLHLNEHPEGGFYKETYRSTERIPPEGLPSLFVGVRNFSTAIYFLLRSQDRSMFHRIKSDELWHFHAGSSLSIFVLDKTGLTVFKLGENPEEGESLQVMIPANSWFGATVNKQDSFTLAGCTVAPGFDFQDFELANRIELINAFPVHQEIIERLTP